MEIIVIIKKRLDLLLFTIYKKKSAFLTNCRELLELGTKYLPELSHNKNPSAERHPYHLVKPSPKPILASSIIFLILSHFLQYLTDI